MELTVTDVARQAGCTPRFVRRSVATGLLAAHRVVGGRLLLDDVAVMVWTRSTARGKPWTPRTRDAALDLLTCGDTDALTGSARSRLKSSLRTMPITSIAHAARGLTGSWVRYRAEATDGFIGPTAVRASDLGIVHTDPWMTFVETADLDQWEFEHAAALDPDGNVGVVERPVGDARLARSLLDCYLLGDARVSSAAAEQLLGRAREL